MNHGLHFYQASPFGGSTNWQWFLVEPFHLPRSYYSQRTWHTMNLFSPFHLCDCSKAVKWYSYGKYLLANISKYLLGTYHAQGTREDTKSVEERGPALVVKGKIVQEEHVVKGWVIQEGSLGEVGQVSLSPEKLQSVRDQWRLMTRGLEQYIYYNFKLKSDDLVNKQATTGWNNMT